MELQLIQQKIFEIRGYRVMMDYDLAKLYEVETKELKRAVKRNITRFPSDFMFELSEKEYEALRYQFGTSNSTDHLRSQFVTSKEEVTDIYLLLLQSKELLCYPVFSEVPKLLKSTLPSCVLSSCYAN